MSTERNYILTDEVINHNSVELYRIKCIKDFYNGENLITEGTLGGFIEKIENLYGNAWIYGNAKVYGKAKVYGNAKVRSEAEIFNNAKIYNNAEVCDNAKIYDDAFVCDKARVRNNAKVYGNAMIYNEAKIYGSAKVYNNARIYGEAKVYSNAEVSQNQYISVGRCTANLTNNISESIRCQCNLIPFDGKVIAYKQVNKNMTSFYDDDFTYEVGKVAEVDNYDMSSATSCASGLHFSNANYWNENENIKNSIFLVAEIKLKDIIAVQAGKIRCRKALIIGKYEI